MPTVAVDRDELFARLGKTYTDEEFDELCFEFGVELDDVLTEAEANAARGSAGGASSASGTVSSSRVIYYIAIPANRTDLLCIEGIARAFNVFLGNQPTPVYNTLDGSSPIVVTVKPETQQIRPYIVAAVLRGVTFTPARYQSFIDLQDKLHTNICRRRTLVAIGTHDLATLQPPFTYEARAPEAIEFVPLSQSKSFRADNLMHFYRTDPSVKHINPYVDIIASSPVYPCIYDSQGTLLSLPPIINGHHSRITLDTKDVFIECTATDLTKAHVVLNTMVCMFAEYCAQPFSCERVTVQYEEPVTVVKLGGGASNAASSGSIERVEGYVTPDLSPRPAHAAMSRICGLMGVDIDAATAASLASKMQLSASPAGDGLDVLVPPTRADVLHECDIAEDVAIAYGYNNLPKTLPRTTTSGHQQPVNKLTDMLRNELAYAGYTEALTFALLSREENYAWMLQEDRTGTEAVEIANPQTEDFQIGRTTMLPGLLKTLAANRSIGWREGVKVFEISDVMLRDDTHDTGSRNERRLAAVYAGPTAGYEIIHGLVDRVMTLLEVPVRPFAWSEAAVARDAPETFGRGGLRFAIEKDDSVPSFFPGRGGRIVLEKADGTTVAIGHCGVLHPKVLKNFELSYPASVVEINIEPFLAQ